MINHLKIFFLILAGFISLSLTFPAKEFSNLHSESKDRYRQTEYGPALDWLPQIKLEWNDFKAASNTGKGFSVATSTCGFGLESETENGNTSHSIFVRFYCKESWHNSAVKIPEVLAHEQLHFDICEIYGRKLFKELLQLKNAGKLDNKKAEEIYNNLTNAYNDYQDLYDKETEHSTNGQKQKEWNEKVRRELSSLAAYGAYHSF